VGQTTSSCEKTYSDKISGTEVNYYFLCKRRCWLCRHRIMITGDNPHVVRGRIIDERTRRGHGELQLGRNKFDIVVKSEEGVVVHEYKKGKKTRTSAEFQLFHYLRCLKEYGLESKGVLHNVSGKKTSRYSLDKGKEEKLLEAYNEILILDNQDIPPVSKKKLCHNGCSFEEFCWS